MKLEVVILLMQLFAPIDVLNYFVRLQHNYYFIEGKNP
jgi:hypothetical protein